jgi:hypothetical protein
MATKEKKNALRAVYACAWLALLAAGCGNLDEAADLALRKTPATADGGTGTSDPPNATGVATASTSAGANVPGGDPKAGGMPGPAGCTMREDDKQVCVVCQDAKGTVVRDGCYTKDPQPAGAECHDIKRVDGSLCTVCFDRGGTVIKSSCRSPDSNGCSMPGSPPTAIACKDYIDGKQMCTVCRDADGKVVKMGCSDPGTGTGNGCDETKQSDGTVCTVCRDPMGNVIKKGCTVPMPQPDPAGVKCYDVDEKGVRCTICVDASGKEIKRGCWATTGGMPNEPAPSCKEYRSDDGMICVICVDQKGTIVKQSCGAPATMPGATPANG